MRIFLVILWFVTFSLSSAFILTPKIKEPAKDPVHLLWLPVFFLFWPIGLIFLIKQFPSTFRWWQKQIQDNKHVKVKFFLFILVSPIALLGLMEGHGDLGSFWGTLIFILCAWGNLLIYLQFIKYVGVL